MGEVTGLDSDHPDTSRWAGLQVDLLPHTWIGNQSLFERVAAREDSHASADIPHSHLAGQRRSLTI